MTGPRPTRGRAIPVPHPPDVQDWTQLMTTLTTELDLQGRALQNRSAKAGTPIGKSTWHRVLSGHTLPSASVLDLMVGSGRFTPEQRRELVAAWEKAADYLDRIDATRRSGTTAPRGPEGGEADRPSGPPEDEPDPAPAELPAPTPGRARRSAGRITGLASIAVACAALTVYLAGNGIDPTTAKDSADAASTTTTASPPAVRGAAGGSTAVGATASASAIASASAPPLPSTPAVAGTPVAAGPPADPASQPPLSQPAPPTERPGIEKGSLGADSRCSAPFPGPEVVTWRVCVRVEADRVSIALKVTNRASLPTRAKVRLEFARAGKVYPCPGVPGAHVIDLDAGTTVITPPADCATVREPIPLAYQGLGRVVAADATDAAYNVSPTANVYPDRPTIWRPDLIE
ncbi:hypothetical protein ACIRST_15530 [Kitasatospora sp. NPDC101447]|uniref:hypothetical protein n=1 Tax=Kitasatospora sp. NPDC101447 TaxID=3364102 RepID=UPI003801EB49